MSAEDARGEGRRGRMRPRTGSEVKAVLDAERRGSAFIVLRDGGDELLILGLADDRPMLTLGRHSACDVALSWDPRISSTHAVLELLGKTWTISDDGISRNGTFVNDVRIGSRRPPAYPDDIPLRTPPL